MTDYRAQAIASSSAVVVKVGTRVLQDAAGHLDLHRIDQLANGLTAFAATGRQVILVSSGAVAAGVAKLGLAERPRMLARLQAVAAIGQAHLIQAYERALAPRGLHAAQVLLTAGDLRRRSGYLHVRNTLRQIHELGSIAIMNENDSVAVAELQTTFGDNDRLAANVAGLLPEALLVILSDVDGLYDGPPERADSQLIGVVETVSDEILTLARGHQSQVSKGGMLSKLKAARLANRHGHAVIIGPGRRDDVLEQIIAGAEIGTLFLPQDRRQTGRRRWIGSTADVAGSLIVDAGAARAITETGASLLAVGVRAVEGRFSRGAVVKVITLDGAEIARGLVNYHSDDVRAIRGLATDEIAKVLGTCPYDAVVHRDNMALEK